MKGDCSMELNEINFETKDSLSFTEDDGVIVDYLYDRHGKEILSSLQNRPENTGVAAFFHDPENLKDFVIVMRMKNFKDNHDNGLVMFVIHDIYKSSRAKEGLIEIVRKTFNGNRSLRDAIIREIEKHVIKSINHNA